MSDSAHTKNPNEPVLRPHTYDGIREFDQRLPNWWLFTLYIMMAFTLAYWLAAWQFGVFSRDGALADAQISAMRIFSPSRMALLSSSDGDIQLWKWSRDPSHTAKGRETFDLTCAACHAKDLSAKLNGVPLPGLPLNDEEWKYGGKPTDILKTVTKGSPDISKGMIAWENVLGPSKCADVVAYVLSHHNPPKGLLDSPAPKEGPASPSP